MKILFSALEVYLLCQFAHLNRLMATVTPLCP